MPRTLDPAMILGARKAYLRGDEAVAYKLQAVLETRPGQLPWQPQFGCDLTALVGQPATAQRMAEARWKVEQAVKQWVPEVELLDCRVQVVALETGHERGRDPATPLAEAALLNLGSQAVLEVELDVMTDQGLLAMQAQVEV